MEILPPAIENGDLISPGCRGLERVAKEGGHQDRSLAGGGGPLTEMV